MLFRIQVAGSLYPKKDRMDHRIARIISRAGISQTATPVYLIQPARHQDLLKQTMTSRVLL